MICSLYIYTVHTMSSLESANLLPLLHAGSNGAKTRKSEAQGGRFFFAIYIYYLYVHIYIYPLISLSSATVGCFLKQPAKTLWIDSNARALLLYTDYIYMHINTYINPFLLPSLMYITLYLPYTTSLAQSR